MRFPTGGIAHEPQGMIRCDSEADSTVWMEEDYLIAHLTCFLLYISSGMIFISELFYVIEKCFYRCLEIYIFKAAFSLIGLGCQKVLLQASQANMTKMYLQRTS